MKPYKVFEPYREKQKMQYEVMKEFKFCSSHRLLGHKGACAHIHGHNYRVEVYVNNCRKNSLDDMDMVIDFSDVKNIIGKMIDEKFDHGIMVNNKDIEFLNLIKSLKYPQKVFAFDSNPTAEKIAEFILRVGTVSIREKYPGVSVDKVIVWETDTCFAEVTNYG